MKWMEVNLISEDGFESKKRGQRNAVIKVSKIDKNQYTTTAHETWVFHLHCKTKSQFHYHEHKNSLSLAAPTLLERNLHICMDLDVHVN